MKFLAIGFLILHSLCGAQTWARLADFPGTKRDDGVAVVVGNTAYFGTGLQEGWSATIDWYALDLNTLSWSRIPDMPHTTERQYACAFAGKNCFYVFGGSGIGGALNNLYKYDIATQTWMNMATKPGGGLIAASCMPFGDRVVFAGGRLNSGAMNREVWEYNLISNSWQQKNNIPFSGRWRAGAANLNNFGYLLFGIDTNFTFRKELYRYDLNFDSWTKVSDFPLPVGRAYAAVESAAHKLFVFGGYDSLNNYYTDSWYYNDVLNAWSQAPSLPSFGRRGGLYCVANDDFYYTCGLDKPNNRLNETWKTDIPLAIEKLSETPPELFSFFPNPAGTFISVVGKPPAMVFIHQPNGTEVLRQSLYSENTIVSLVELPKGMYFVRIVAENGQECRLKLVHTAE